MRGQNRHAKGIGPTLRLRTGRRDGPVWLFPIRRVGAAPGSGAVLGLGYRRNRCCACSAACTEDFFGCCPPGYASPVVLARAGVKENSRVPRLNTNVSYQPLPAARANRHAKGIGPTLRGVLGGATASSGIFPLGGWERRRAPVPCVRRGKHKPNRHVRFIYRCYSIMPNSRTGARPGPLPRLIRRQNRQSPFLSDVCGRDLGTGRSPICPRTPAWLRCRASDGGRGSAGATA